MKTGTAKLYNWAIEKAGSKLAPLWIATLFSLELVLFIPLDAILMFFCLQNRQKTFYYVLIAAICSTLSGVIGYLLGHFLWDLIGSYIVPHLISSASFKTMALHFQNYENWAVFLGALFPFPLKALSLSAGVFHVDLFPFICCFFVARLLRFFLVGGAMVLWGEKVKLFLDKHFQRVLLLIGVKIAAAFLFFWILAS
jgi:membrane protein YqaA with SNARE-associated domain